MIRISSMLAAGAFACAAMTAPLSFASANDAATTEFSAQERQQRQKATTTTRTIEAVRRHSPQHDHHPGRRHGEDAYVHHSHPARQRRRDR